jgi:hypothetical protein
MVTNTDSLPITLPELVTSVAGVVPRVRRDLVERRIAHWINRGVLKPIGQLHVGSGRSRFFDPEQAYVAALLLRLPLLSIGGVKAVAQVVAAALAKHERTAELWAAAKDRHDTHANGAVFAGFGFLLDEAGEKPAAVYMGVERAPNRSYFDTPSFRLEGDYSLTIINLSVTFAAVRFP